MRKFEYKRVTVEQGHLLEEEFNKLGQEGWELVNVDVGKLSYFAIFKREIVKSFLDEAGSLLES